MGSARNGFRSNAFARFCRNIELYRNRVEALYTGAVYPQGTRFAGQTYNSENGAVNPYSADVLIPAFLASYTSMGKKHLGIFPTIARMLPNWTLRYSGLSRLSFMQELFKSVNINHAYKSTYSVGSYASYSTWQEYQNGLGFITDATTGNPIPNSMYNVSMVNIAESFSPLLGVDVTLHNNLTAKLEYRTTRTLNLSLTSMQINEAKSNDWVVGMGYKINDFKIFGSKGKRKSKQSRNQNDNQTDNKKTNTSSRRNQFNNDLNLRLDLSYRKQANISRDIPTQSSTASSGNTAFKLSFLADYTVSRLLTLSFYYDRQTNTPLLSANSYPITTQDFGLSLKFSLTR